MRRYLETPGGVAAALNRYDDSLRPQPKVKAACRICYRGEKTRQMVMAEPMLISANGIVHRGTSYGMTWCGKDATGDKWWWRA